MPWGLPIRKKEDSIDIRFRHLSRVMTMMHLFKMLILGLVMTLLTACTSYVWYK